MAGHDIVTDKIKLYVAPLLLTAISLLFSATSYFIWSDISEMKGDVKKLVAESEYRRAKEEQMEKDITELKNAVYVGKKSFSAILGTDAEKEKSDNKIPTYFINEETITFKKKVKSFIVC